MAFEVPPLPYDYNALEPTIDDETMHLHHDKHHQAYVTNANKALEGTEWADKPVEEVLQNLQAIPEEKRQRGPQQRRRPLQPLAVLGVDVPERRRPARRRPGRRDRRRVRLVRRVQGKAEGRRRRPVRVRLGVARPRRVRARGRLDPQPGQPDLLRPGTAARSRRLGARVLPQVPEPPPGLPRRLVERRELAQGRGAVRGGLGRPAREGHGREATAIRSTVPSRWPP